MSKTPMYEIITEKGILVADANEELLASVRQEVYSEELKKVFIADVKYGPREHCITRKEVYNPPFSPENSFFAIRDAANSLLGLAEVNFSGKSRLLDILDESYGVQLCGAVIESFIVDSCNNNTKYKWLGMPLLRLIMNVTQEKGIKNIILPVIRGAIYVPNIKNFGFEVYPISSGEAGLKDNEILYNDYPVRIFTNYYNEGKGVVTSQPEWFRAKSDIISRLGLTNQEIIQLLRDKDKNHDFMEKCADEDIIVRYVEVDAEGNVNDTCNYVAGEPDIKLIDAPQDWTNPKGLKKYLEIFFTLAQWGK